MKLAGCSGEEIFFFKFQYFAIISPWRTALSFILNLPNCSGKEFENVKS
jgi:hypothetical protein